MAFQKIGIQGATYVDLSARAKLALAEHAGHACHALALLMCNAIQEVIDRGTPSGRIYRLPGLKRGRGRKRGAAAAKAAKGTRTREYRASAPGEPPADRLGQYKTSWIATPAVQEGNHVTAFAYTPEQVGRAGEHNLGLILQYGAPQASIEPRPHVDEAIALIDKDKIHSLIRKATRPPKGKGGSGAPPEAAP